MQPAGRIYDQHIEPRAFEALSESNSTAAGLGSLLC